MKVISSTIFCLSLLISTSLMPSLAREQWQMNHPPGPAPSYETFSQSLGMVPKFDPNSWQKQLQNRVPAGSVISGVLMDDLSSKKTKQGSIFEIRLLQPYIINGREVIPSDSKIIGYVSQVSPAALMKNGHPGRMDVSLQSLVFPDGRNFPLTGFIDRNPNLDLEDEPQVKRKGFGFKDFGASAGGFVNSLTAGVGSINNRQHRGLDFIIKKGEVLPVKLNKALDLPEPIQLNAEDATANPANPISGQPNGPTQSSNNPASNPSQNGYQGFTSVLRQANTQYGPCPTCLSKIGGETTANSSYQPTNMSTTSQPVVPGLIEEQTNASGTASQASKPTGFNALQAPF